MAENMPPALDFLGKTKASTDQGACENGFEGGVGKTNAGNTRSVPSNTASLPALIAEIKFASPSRGVLLPAKDPQSAASRLGQVYQQNGAAALSVLTDERYFHGSLEYLQLLARQNDHLPLLRKDFLCDPYQVYESRAAGADAILLIAAGLQAECLADLHQLACELGMAALVEVHTLAELEAVLAIGARLVGINNRNLHTFVVNLQTTLELRPYVPAEIGLVAESGIHTRQDVLRLAEAGVDAILVGEALVSAPDIAAKTRELAGVIL